jgi:hypothetical protein
VPFRVYRIPLSNNVTGVTRNRAHGTTFKLELSAFAAAGGVGPGEGPDPPGPNLAKKSHAWSVALISLVPPNPPGQVWPPPATVQCVTLDVGVASPAGMFPHAPQVVQVATPRLNVVEAGPVHCATASFHCVADCKPLEYGTMASELPLKASNGVGAENGHAAGHGTATHCAATGATARNTSPASQANR